MQLAEFLVKYILLKRCCCILDADVDKSGSSMIFHWKMYNMADGCAWFI